MNKLVALIAGLFAPASVESVMASFNATIAKLDKVAEQNMDLISRKSELIENLNSQIDKHDEEADVATRTAARLRAIIS